MDPGRLLLRTHDGRFPAHAGMDPQTLSAPDGVGGFPRPRGDGPSAAPRTTWRYRVSPPTRGWTLRRGAGRDVPGGFPAHAGMDRNLRTLSNTTHRFPRPRGVGPRAPSRWPGTASVPRPRGDGPPPALPMADRPRFPRPRGDGPIQESVAIPYGRVSPPRGDGPWSCALREFVAAVSPPTRGWT